MKLTIVRMAGLATLIAAGVVMIPGFRASAQSTQSNPATTPAFGEDAVFEVASVKLNKSGDQRVQLGFRPGGQFVASNVPLRFLIRNAYQVQDFQIIDAPDWTNSERFDVNAKAEGEVPPSQPGTAGPMQYMIRNLLSDRFKLVIRKETREMPIYSLVLARSDGKLGDKIRPATVDCQAMFAAARRGGQPPAPPQPGERMMCGMRIGIGVLDAGSFPLSQLASTLSTLVNRIVVDKTGLTGNFDFNLEFQPEGRGGLPGLPPPPGPGPGGAVLGGPAPDPALSDRPSIFTALQEQLGLKLDSGRGPVEVLVIDRVERPTED